jgi:hypothetical protein
LMREMMPKGISQRSGTFSEVAVYWPSKIARRLMNGLEYFFYH